MKLTFATLTTMLTLAVLTGCTQGTPGGPGTDAKKPTFGQAENTFNLTVPFLSSTLQQGEKLDTMVGIKRSENFDEDVTLKFADIPKGVTVDPASSMIKRSDENAKITFKAGDQAPLGNFKVKVTGHPSNGSDAEIEFQLTIAPKDSFTLGVPLLSTSLKQGDMQTVSISISRATKFDKDVALSFSDLPTGVTFEPSAPVIKQGEEDAKVTFKAAPDAALGQFSVRVTGHPTQGVDVVNSVQLTVVKQ